ncbi:hypothetical protein [Salinigranum rubrum]|uniref:hypothetical protein n=1 Tax=Salinigranum rubrum TaxID=755307 RepID=UPI0013A58E69|nr:hypothetical protein [Salinigranum rubrum]
MRRKLTAILLTAMLVMTAFSPAAVSAQETETSLGVSLAQDPTTGNATVTVTSDGTPVEDATVNVTSGVTYAGEGTYTTDTEGSIELPNPDQPVDIEVEVTANGTTTTETFTLVPVEDSIDVTLTQDDDGSVHLEATQYGDALVGAEVDVTSTVAYTGEGTYTTDENGSLALPEPASATELTAVVTSGDLEAIRTDSVEPIAEFEVAVEANDDGTATVTVTRDDAAVDNATVAVESDAPYAGNGTDATDENGTLALPEPAETVNVTVTAADGDDEATTVAELSPVDTGLAVDVVQNSDGTATVTVTDDGADVENATVNVTSDVAYDGNGTYETSNDGTVGLPAPDQNLTVTVTAINDSEEATATSDLTLVENGGFANFGLWVSSYVQQLKDGGYFGKEFGQKVSEFATENNPGADNKPDHAGPPERGEENDDADGEAASDDEKRRGPPEHANDDKGADEQDDETEGTEETAEDSAADSDCAADSDEESCEADDTGETDDEAEDDGDDAPGNSGNKGNRGGNGNGNGPKK